jgi:carbon-monoxide dehydrogenase large subunit
VGDVGGGFGMKTGIYPEDIVIAYAARAQRPVRWQAERSEEFLSAFHGRDVVSHASGAGCRRQVLALRGALARQRGRLCHAFASVAIQLLIGPWVSTSIYDIGTIDLHFSGVLTNTTPTSAYRGAGRPEAIYITERLFDAAARDETRSV